jgi:hypothetical protein
MMLEIGGIQYASHDKRVSHWEGETTYTEEGGCRVARDLTAELHGISTRVERELEQFAVLGLFRQFSSRARIQKAGR